MENFCWTEWRSRLRWIIMFCLEDRKFPHEHIHLQYQKREATGIINRKSSENQFCCQDMMQKDMVVKNTGLPVTVKGNHLSQMRLHEHPWYKTDTLHDFRSTLSRYVDSTLTYCPYLRLALTQIIFHPQWALGHMTFMQYGFWASTLVGTGHKK